MDASTRFESLMLLFISSHWPLVDNDIQPVPRPGIDTSLPMSACHYHPDPFAMTPNPEQPRSHAFPISIFPTLISPLISAFAVFPLLAILFFNTFSINASPAL